jgi:hypothetical protein
VDWVRAVSICVFKVKYDGERYHATTQNRFYPDMSNVNKNVTVEAKLISPPTYNCRFTFKRRATKPKVLTDG